MASISYSTLMPIVESWEKVKRIPDWQAKFGDALFRKVFEKAPLSLTLLFPFGTDVGEKMYNNPTFKEASVESSSIMDVCVTSLGADMEIVKMQLLDVFEQHDGFKSIRSDHWIVLGKALLSALEETLGTELDSGTKGCWASAFDSVSTMMIEEAGQ